MANLIRACFEAHTIDNPNETFGFQIELGETDKEFRYSDLIENINIPNLLKFACLDGIVDPTGVKVITPEEYDKEYGEDGTN